MLSSREMGRIYHAKGVERLVRNELWKGRTPERWYDALEWLHGWNVGNCLNNSSQTQNSSEMKLKNIDNHATNEANHGEQN